MAEPFTANLPGPDAGNFLKVTAWENGSWLNTTTWHTSRETPIHQPVIHHDGLDNAGAFEELKSDLPTPRCLAGRHANHCPEVLTMLRYCYLKQRAPGYVIGSYFTARARGRVGLENQSVQQMGLTQIG